MRYYIMKKSVEYVIYKVKDEQILEFEEKYSEEILIAANSLMQLLMLFEQEIMFSLEFPVN